MTDIEIAEALGFSPVTIAHWRHKHKLPSYYIHHKHLQKLRRQRKALQLRHLGLSDEEIASKLNLRPRRVKELIGFQLMQLCRKDSRCPYKALLPEFEKE